MMRAVALVALAGGLAHGAPATRKHADKLVSIGPIQLHYQEYGTGAPLVLLHDFGGCALWWEPVVDLLAARHRVILVDLPGHGRSTTARDQLALRQWARAVIALLARLRVDRVQGIGIGAGAMTLLQMADLAPDRIDAMVLVGAAPHQTEAARMLARKWHKLDQVPPELAAAYRRCAPDKQIGALLVQRMSIAARRDDLAFTRDALAGVRARALIVAGDRDPIYPVELQVELYRALPRAHLWIVPNRELIGPDDAIGADIARAALEFLRGDWEPRPVRLP
jgi:pimeloyl-ACP methyl ester carboxylesterase